jgi:tetratricopeptide (TPR) repeat protein
MIVRDEAAIIERCLASVEPYIDSYYIWDTGSTDGTPEIIEQFFGKAGIPGEVGRGEFINFAASRNQALEQLAASGIPHDYILLIDADMELAVCDRDWKCVLTGDVYNVRQVNVIAYDNIRIIRSGLGARYVGVTHEYLDVGGRPKPRLGGIEMIDHASGFNRAGKFERDATMLAEALETEPDNTRYVFYLAQSYRDAGQLRQAYETYARRVSMAGWIEERFMAQLEMGRLAIRMGKPEAVVSKNLLDAFDLRPIRAEPLHELAAYYRAREQWGRAYIYARAGVEIKIPDDQLFVSQSIYDWMLLDELAVAAYWVGRYEESAQACAAILQKVAHGLVLDEATQARVRENAGFARVKLMP